MRYEKIVGIAVSGIILGLFLAASPAGTVVLHSDDSQRDTLRIRGFETSFLPQLDPAKGESVFVTQQIFDGLVRLDDDLNIVPGLAEYWDISEGGRCYTFYLRKGVRFHDGRELSAGDVLFSLLRLMRGETESPYGRHFIDKVVGAEDFVSGKTPDVAGFRILDPYIFEVRWRNPYVSALSLLSMSFCRILPQETAEKLGRGFFSRPVGTGPFKFDSWIRSPSLDIVGVRLVRNSAYYGRVPSVAAVEYSPYYTYDHFKGRDVQAMPCSAALARLGCKVIEGGELNVSYLMMSCANAPFDRARVRRAMALVIDREAHPGPPRRGRPLPGEPQFHPGQAARISALLRPGGPRPRAGVPDS